MKLFPTPAPDMSLPCSCVADPSPTVRGALSVGMVARDRDCLRCNAQAHAIRMEIATRFPNG